eukprot:TRINITY_DN5632_c0_g1_i3.p1 TRINITY_DN5632_c0_g1~~TRINITY_DN5632_c0_g1_i3.p1  ORF type:complete len:105 (-),score=25.40 TRINITY_DN5632_c0_g1_i3:46-360(-)
MCIRDRLYSVLSNTVSMKRSKKISRACSEMDLLNVGCQLARAKKANIRVSYDKVCAYCLKKIGEKAFVVYPNGITIHQHCSISQNFSPFICPITKQNFETTFSN